VTRRATAARADTGWATRLGDLLSWATTIAVGVALLGGTISGTRESLGDRRPLEAAVLPGWATTVAVGVLLAGGLAALLGRLGPVSATPATAAWWLPLPAGRRGLLRGELLRVLLLALAAAVVVALPLLAGGRPDPTPATVGAGLAGAGALAAALVGGLAVLQSAGRGRRVPSVAGAVATAAVVGPAAVASVAAALQLGLPAVPVPDGLPPASAVVLPVAAGTLAAGALLAADRRLDRLPAGVLRSRGQTAVYASASAVSMDTRELGRALGTVVRPPRRARTWRRVRTPGQAVVAADLAVLARSPWRWGQLAVGAALPVLAARTSGLAEVPALVAVAAALGWGLAAVAVGEPSRRAQASPAADRALPLSARGVLRARAAVPAAVLAAVCGVSALLVGVGSGAPVGWLVLGVAAAPAWAGAAVRGGYRPELDWTGPVLSSPMGALPLGVGATLVRGPDLGLLGTAPAALALFLGSPSIVLVAAQVAWGLAVGVLAVETARPAS
jgi:hypothetical protein